MGGHSYDWLVIDNLCNCNQVRCRERLLDCIGNSPLLGEDDFQLVQFIVSNCQMHCSSSNHHSPYQNGHHHPSNRHTIFFLIAFLVGLIAIASTLLPVQYILVLSILAILTGGVPLTVRWRMKVAVEQRLDKLMDTLQTYLREFETLLSLVTQTTRIIRETEIIAHGFSRYGNQWLYCIQKKNVVRSNLLEM